MNIALLNERITFQRNQNEVDSIGNHTNSWKDVFSCYATIGGESGGEAARAGQTVEDGNCTFTVRYCSETAVVSPLTHRILFHGEIYDITSVDHMNFKMKSLKFSCRKVRR